MTDMHKLVMHGHIERKVNHELLQVADTIFNKQDD